MTTILHLLPCDGCTDKLHYQRSISALALAKAFADLFIISLVPDLGIQHVIKSWVSPFALIGPWLANALPLALCLSTFAFFAGFVWNSAHRARDIGWVHWSGLIAVIPFMNVLFTVVLFVRPSKKHSVWDLV